MDHPAEHPSPPSPTRLSVVIVNYNGWDDTRELVASLADSDAVRTGRADIVVVDNASPAPMPDDFLPLPTGACLVRRPDNGGFSVGVNEGVRRAGADWILVLNPDVTAKTDLIGRILDRIENYGKRPEGVPGVVGFALRNEDGTPQPSVGALPSLFRAFWEQLIPRSRRKYQPDRLVRPGPVPWVTGACVLLNRRMLRDVGGMDEDFFLYYEEVALCRSAVKAGWSVEFDPAVEVVHLRPLQNRAISPKMRLVTRHSRLLYFRKHLPAWQFHGLSGLILAEAGVRRLLARSAEERRAWDAAARVAALLRTGVEIRGATVRDLGELLADEGISGRDWPNVLAAAIPAEA